MNDKLPVKLRQETYTYLACPYKGCEGEHSIGHLLNGRACSFGPWSCQECGRMFGGSVTVDGTITVEERPGTMQEGLVLLRLQRPEGPLYLVVHDRYFPPLEEGETENDRFDRKRFYYEEHTCPTNYIPIYDILAPEDVDPHGAFEFVGLSRPYAPEELARGSEEERYAQIRELFRNLGVPYPGNG